jgi:hypothetical protein
VGWTSQTVSLNRIDKDGAPIVNVGNLWKDTSDAAFYAYNGDLASESYDVVSPANELWRFTPSGISGTWSNLGVSAGASLDFTDLVRVANAASVVANGIGYALGGYQSSGTTDKAPFYENGEAVSGLRMPVSGMVAYDMATGSWSNSTDSSFTQSGSFSRGQLQHLPDYGAAGLLIPLGGSTSNASDDNDGRIPVDDLNTLSMYDIASGTWHTQRTSGEIPQSRVAFCSVGVRGDDGTFEVSCANQTKKSASADEMIDLHIWRPPCHRAEERRPRRSVCAFFPCFSLAEVDLPTCTSSTSAHLQYSRPWTPTDGRYWRCGWHYCQSFRQARPVATRHRHF